MSGKKNYNHNKFLVAFRGINDVFVAESSFRYQFIVLIITITLSFLFRISLIEWITIILATMVVFALEIMNTAIENIVDIISPEYNEVAGKVKDISAGAVLLSTIGAVIIGIIIFLPKMIMLI